MVRFQWSELFWPGPDHSESREDSDGWRTVKAPRRCLACARGGCPLCGDNSQEPQTLRDTLETGGALGGQNQHGTVRNHKHTAGILKVRQCKLKYKSVILNNIKNGAV